MGFYGILPSGNDEQRDFSWDFRMIVSWIFRVMKNPLIIKHGLLEDGPFISDSPIKSRIHRSCFTAMLDYQRVLIFLRVLGVKNGGFMDFNGCS